MTEYEVATLAIREASMWVAVAHVAATLIIGAAQIAIVWHGIRVMQRTGERRAREQDQRHVEAVRQQDQNHAESMRALEALISGMEVVIERTAPRAG